MCLLAGSTKSSSSCSWSDSALTLPQTCSFSASSSRNVLINYWHTPSPPPQSYQITAGQKHNSVRLFLTCWIAEGERTWILWEPELLWFNYRKSGPVAGLYCGMCCDRCKYPQAILLSEAGLDTGKFLSNLLKSPCFVSLSKEATVVCAGLVVPPTLGCGTVGWREL